MKFYQKLNDKMLKIIGVGSLLISYFWYLNYFNSNILRLLDSDMSSELVLSNLLYKEGSILSKNWYYSTELRVINNQLIFAPLFKFFNNWKDVRLFGTAILIGLLVLSFLFLCKQLEIKNSEFYALFFLMPLSSDYFSFVLIGAYYVPHIIISFITIGLFINILKSDKRGKLYPVKIGIIILLAFGAGLGGLRQLLILYIPLFLSIPLSHITQKKVRIETVNLVKEIAFSLEMILVSLTTLSSFIGYLVNSKILSQIYSYNNYQKINFTPLSFERLQNLFNGWINTLGYQSSGGIFSKTLIINFGFLSIFCVIVYVIVKVIKSNNIDNQYYSFIIYFILVSFSIISILFLFTDMGYLDRYLLPVSIWVVPLIAIFGNLICRDKKRIFYILFLVLYFVFVSKNFYTFNLFSENQVVKTTELQNMTKMLEDKGYKEGYSSFWNANVLTELSNGKLNVWCYGANNEMIDFNQVFKWLQNRNHEIEKPKGKVFVLLMQDELENNKQLLENQNVIYKSDKYIIFSFKNNIQLEKMNQ